MVKYCSKCGEVKSCSEFNKDRSKVDGLYPQCKECRRGHYVDNRERKARYYQSNRAQRIDYSHRWYEANPMAWRLTNGRRRARANGLPADAFNGGELVAYWESQGIDPAKDYYTGEPLEEDWHLDHAIPLSDPQSPGHQLGNVVPCNAATNIRKGKLTATEFMAQLEETGKAGPSVSGSESDPNGNVRLYQLPQSWVVTRSLEPA